MNKGNVKKIILLLFLLLIISPIFCGCIKSESKLQVNHVQSSTLGSEYSIECIDGVEYLHGYRSLAPHLLADEEGRPYLVKCENK